MEIKPGLYKDIVRALEEALAKMSDTCDCNPKQEWDTGAWIHDEENCQSFVYTHIEATLELLLQRGKEQGF